ncbi:MAG: arginase family protein [Hasllibacter sp.]
MVGLSDMFGEGGGGLLGLPEAPPDGAAGRLAVIGADCATPYPSVGPYCAGAPAALRAAARRQSHSFDRVSFDLGRAGMPDAVDCGDLPVDPVDPAGNRAVIEAAVRGLAGQGSTVVLLGGDDSVQIPMLAALDAGPLHVVQVDAHIDWRDEVAGERWGLSSTQRRASEMGHVAGQVLVGQWGFGSAGPADLAAAEAAGAVLVPAREVARQGVGRAVGAVPEGARVAVCLDLDGLDPSVIPSVIAPTPGGLSHWDVLDLVEGIAAKAQIVALGFVELAPGNDPDGRGADQAVQLLASLIGTIAPR